MVTKSASFIELNFWSKVGFGTPPAKLNLVFVVKESGALSVLFAGTPRVKQLVP